MDEDKSSTPIHSSPSAPPQSLLLFCSGSSADAEMSKDGNRIACARPPSPAPSSTPSRLRGAQPGTLGIDEGRVIASTLRPCHTLGGCSSTQVYERLETPTTVLHSPSEVEHGGNRSGVIIRDPPISDSPTVAESRAEEVTLSKDYLYSCKFCMMVAKKPVLNLICGHLFCWSCVCANSTVRHCPCCESHFDSAKGNSMTIVPVYSGRYPGDECPTYIEEESEESIDEDSEESIDEDSEESSDDESEESSDDESEEFCLFDEEKNLANETKTDGVVIPPYPRRNQYASLTMFVASMLGWVNILTDVCQLSYFNEDSDLDVDFVNKLVERTTARVVKELLSALKWLTGEECTARRVVCHEFPETQKVEEHPRCENSVTVRERSDFDENVQQPFRKVEAASYTAESISMFSCRCCSKTAFEPVVTFCGHLFCWSCLYRKHCVQRQCPACEARIDTETLWYYVCPINGTLTLPEEVAELLAAKETCMDSQHGNDDDESLVPNFPNPHLAIGFLQYIIDEVHKAKAELKKKIDNLCERDTILDTDAINILSIKLKVIVTNLIARLRSEWRTIVAEKKPSRARTLMLNPKRPLKSDGICDATDTMTSYQPEDRNVKRLKGRG